MTFEIEFNERNSKYSDRFKFQTRISKNSFKIHVMLRFRFFLTVKAMLFILVIAIVHCNAAIRRLLRKLPHLESLKRQGKQFLQAVLKPVFR